MRNILLLLLISVTFAAWGHGYPYSRLAIEENTNPEELVMDCETISLEVTKNPLPGYPKTIHALYDFHIVADVSLAKIVKVFEVREKYTDVYPRLFEYRWQDAGRSEHGQEIIEEELVGASVLGIKSMYHYKLRTLLLDDSSETSKSMVWVLEKSLDGSIDDIAGSWYLEEIEIDGRKHTYMRYYSETYFVKPRSGLKSILKAFTRGDIRKMFVSIIKAAKNY